MKHRLRFAGKKLIRMLLLLLGVSLAAFLLMSASPLDPLQTNVGQAALGTMSQEQIAPQKIHPHGHGWSIVNNVDPWGWS